MKTYPKVFLPILLVAAMAVACASLYTGVVTITSVVDTAMKSWADMSVKNLTTPAIDARVIEAHAIYRGACGVAQGALVSYKMSGDPAQYNAAVQQAKAAANALLDLIVPLLTAKDGTELKTQLANAKTL